MLAPDLGSDELGPLPLLPPIFRRGDCDSNGTVGVNDSIASLLYVVLGTFQSICLDACDADDNGAVDTTDAIATLLYAVLGTFNIPTPGPFLCYDDPTSDVSGDLGCVDDSACAE